MRENLLLRASPPDLICCPLQGSPPPPPPPPPQLVLASSGTRTMESSGMLRVLLLVVLLSVLCHGQTHQLSAEDYDAEKPELAADRNLVGALEVLLGQVQDHISSTEKRGSIPLCGMGNRCAMKYGPRIGKLCDCGRGANCNSYLLKCI